MPLQKKKTKRLKRFKFHTLMGHFQVPTNIMAVKGLMLDCLSFSFTVLITLKALTVTTF